MVFPLFRIGSARPPSLERAMWPGRPILAPRCGGRLTTCWRPSGMASQSHEVVSLAGDCIQGPPWRDGPSTAPIGKVGRICSCAPPHAVDGCALRAHGRRLRRYLGCKAPLFVFLWGCSSCCRPLWSARRCSVLLHGLRWCAQRVCLPVSWHVGARQMVEVGRSP